MKKQRLISRKLMIQKMSVAAGGLLLLEPMLSVSGSLAQESSFSQSPLTYGYHGLEPIIDSMTMEIHYSKHAAGYCTNLNNAVKEYQIDISKGLEFILSNISNYPTIVRNHGGGHYNHELFWKCMKPGGSLLQDNQLKKDIIISFGSVENFQKAFSDAALSRFGSGWTWLIASRDGKLKIDSTPNQDNPLMDIVSLQGYPLLGLDVWEHAYYLKYQNRRFDYVKQWWGILDWDFVSLRYASLPSRF